MNPANTGYVNPGYTYPQPTLYDARATIAEEKIASLEKQIELLQRQLEFVQTLYLKQQAPTPSASLDKHMEPHVPSTLPSTPVAPASPKAAVQKGGAVQAAHASVTTTASPAAMSSRRTIV